MISVTPSVDKACSAFKEVSLKKGETERYQNVQKALREFWRFCYMVRFTQVHLSYIRNFYIRSYEEIVWCLLLAMELVLLYMAFKVGNAGGIMFKLILIPQQLLTNFGRLA